MAVTLNQAKSWSGLMNVEEILAAGLHRPNFLVTRPADPEADPPRPALGLIPEGSYTLLAADPGHGKTWIALELARLLAWPPEEGKPREQWLGVYDVEPRGVLYVDRENGPNLIGYRLKGLGLRKGSRLNLWPQASDQSARLLLDGNGTNSILSCCEQFGLKVVILDSLVRFHSADENSSSAMGEVAVQIQRLKAAGLTVIALHHNRKGGGTAADRMRGSIEIMAAADTVLHLAKSPGNPNRFKLSASKLRYVKEEDFREHWFERRDPQADVFEFVKVSDISKTDAGGEKKGAKTRRRRTSEVTPEQKAEQLKPEVRAAIRDMKAADEKMDHEAIAKKCQKNKSDVIRTLNLLLHDKEIVALPRRGGYDLVEEGSA
jgi:RecA-family ATPase